MPNLTKFTWTDGTSDEISLTKIDDNFTAKYGRQKADLKELSIGEEVRSIESNAFKMCKNLEKVSMSPSVEKISVFAFAWCEKLTEIDLPRIRMEVECSKGTYIRTLCHDIGEKLGCGGCMESLLRTRVGGFTLADSRKLDEVEEIVRNDRMDEILIPTDRVFDQMREVRTREPYDRLAHNGSPVERDWLDAGAAGVTEAIFGKDEMVRLYDSRGIFVGVYRYEPVKERFRLEKMFYDPECPDK